MDEFTTGRRTKVNTVRTTNIGPSNDQVVHFTVGATLDDEMELGSWVLIVSEECTHSETNIQSTMIRSCTDQLVLVTIRRKRGLENSARASRIVTDVPCIPAKITVPLEASFAVGRVHLKVVGVLDDDHVPSSRGYHTVNTKDRVGGETEYYLFE